jgi:hypothetical protein
MTSDNVWEIPCPSDLKRKEYSYHRRLVNRNKTSHRDILCPGVLDLGSGAVQRFWYGWKM